MMAIRSILVLLALFAALTGTAVAQEPEMITKTFELTINGTVPEGETFVASVFFNPTDGGDVENLLFCGGFSDVECTGSGTVYRQRVEIPQGATARYTVQRGNESDGGTTVDIFAEGREMLTGNRTNSVSFTYPGVDDDQQEMPAEVPATGAGGVATAGGVPHLYAGFAALCLLAAAGSSVLRRR